MSTDVATLTLSHYYKCQTDLLQAMESQNHRMIVVAEVGAVSSVISFSDL